MKNSLFFLMLCSVFAQAQYTTPDTGETFTLPDLLLVEPAILVVSDTGEYSLMADLTISANDSFLIDEAVTLKMDTDVRITVDGSFTSVGTADAPIIITAENMETPHDGFRFNEGSSISLSYTHFIYGGGLKTITADFSMDHCLVKYQHSGASTGAAVSFSNGAPSITNSQFIQNQTPAISSGANQSVAVQFIGNSLEHNGLANQNRPQINLGPSGASDSIRIENNSILGDRTKDKVGGIAISNFFSGPNHVLIKNNQIKDNRYGLTLVGPVAYAEIDSNIIEDNDSQGSPNLGGSGINLNAGGETITQTIYIKNNTITGNLWGVTLQGASFANLGDGSELSPGGNTFSENGNSGIVYALYNNTPNDIMAQGNCWIAGQESTEEEVAAVIFDQADIENLGTVDYANFLCNLSTMNVNLEQEVIIYPNPVKEVLFVEIEENAQLSIYNSLGKLVRQTDLNVGKNELQIKLAAGVYFLQVKSDHNNFSKKLMVK